jgi:hypothetical protein
MTEFNPFGTAEQPETYAPEQEEISEGGRNKVLVIVLGAVAGLALAAGGFLFLSGSDDAEELAPVARPAVPAAAAPVASAQPKLPAPANLTLGRNPFRALYVEPAPAPAPAPPAVTPPGATDGGPQVIIVGGGNTGGTTGGGAAPAPQQPTVKEHKLVLLRVFGTGKDQSASFSIDDKQQTAKVGTTFGPTAEILLLSLQEGPKEGQWTAVLQVGDGDPFDVVLGEPVFVR